MKFCNLSGEEAEILVAARAVLLPKRGRSRDFGRSKIASVPKEEKGKFQSYKDTVT
jgi:hypothetical protein